MAAPKGKPGQMRETIRGLLELGQTPRQISRGLDLSTAQVYDHMAKLRAAGQLPREKAKAS